KRGGMNEKPNHFLVLALIAGLATADLGVAEQADTNTDQVRAADLKEFNDPTILSRRVWLETEWNKFTDGTHFVEEIWGALWAWPVSENQDFGVRLKLPVKFRVGSDDPNVSDIGGLGGFKEAAAQPFLCGRQCASGAAWIWKCRQDVTSSATTPGGFRSSVHWVGTSHRGSPSVRPSSTTRHSPKKGVHQRCTSSRRSFRSLLFFHTNGP